MPVPAGVRSCVAIGRVVAAADVPAFQADAQMQPPTAGSEAVFASVDGLRQVGDQDVI